MSYFILVTLAFHIGRIKRAKYSARPSRRPLNVAVPAVSVPVQTLTDPFVQISQSTYSCRTSLARSTWMDGIIGWIGWTGHLLLWGLSVFQFHFFGRERDIFCRPLTLSPSLSLFIYFISFFCPLYSRFAILGLLI